MTEQLWKTIQPFLTKLNIYFLYNPDFPLLGIYLREAKAQRLTCLYYTAKEIINKMKRQLPEREKIFANNISDKELISKVYKELI